MNFHEKIFVACALLVRSNKILLQDREWISKYWEKWSFFWWWLEPWEDHKNTLIREIDEELSLKIQDWNIVYLWKIVHYLNDIGAEYHRYLYFIEAPNSIKKFNDKEWNWAYFYDLNKLNSLKFNTRIDAEILILKNYLWL